jgi:plasmid stabilization system protein ParE
MFAGRRYEASRGKVRLEIELTAQAEADLVEIGDFIAKDNPSAAER